MSEASPRKKRRLTSWQRRKKEAAVAKPATEQGKRLKTLQAELAEAKAASQDARDRYRLHQAAEHGDAQLVARYSEAKKAFRDFMNSRKSEEVQPDARKPKEAPQETRVTEASDAKSCRPKRQAAAGGANCVSVFTAEALGVSPEERRLAKKAAKKAAKGQASSA